MNQVQFTEHAVQRLFGRMNGVVSYAEVQSILAGKPLRNGFNRVLVKTLNSTAVVKDEAAFNGQVKGNKVYALTEVVGNGVLVKTVALSY